LEGAIIYKLIIQFINHEGKMDEIVESSLSKEDVLDNIDHFSDGYKEIKFTIISDKYKER